MERNPKDDPNFLELCELIKTLCICDTCGKENPPLRCGQCRCNFYCDRECQKKDWKSHKGICKGLQKKIEESATLAETATDFEKKYNEHSGSSCSICYEVIESPVQLPCHHIFCSSCMTSYGDRTIFIKCPLCRSELDTNLFQYVYGNAVRFIQCANNFPVDSPMRLHFLKIARQEMERFKSIVAQSEFQVAKRAYLMTEAELLNDEKRHEEALELINRLMIEHETEINEDSLIRSNLLYEKALALEGLQRYQDALRVAKLEYLLKFNQDDCGSMEHAKFYHRFFLLIMRCHYHRKEYLESLAAGHACLDINRVYNDFYEYIAWSFDALGYRDEAIAAFQKAIRYVEPWNPNAKVKYERYLADLLDECEKKENADGES